jgi:hypothetical protein
MLALGGALVRQVGKYIHIYYYILNGLPNEMSEAFRSYDRKLSQRGSIDVKKLCGIVLFFAV